ncbi:MAG TPA: class I SAM-dependent methyltransferase [Acidobacteriota bacterium]|jgi:SAM-dependent methyltransferase
MYKESLAKNAGIETLGGLTENPCPSCRSGRMSVFYEVRSVPVHSVLLMPTRQTAMNYPRGDVVLGFCSTCGFISNVAFDSAVHEYSANYEETQGFSPTFNTFSQRLAKHLIERYDLHEKVIIELGCGKGEFLALLCELGSNYGIGFDPGYVPERNNSQAKDRMTFIKDFYSTKYANYRGDFICCKMTLEHIKQTADFVRLVRRSLPDQSDTVVFFQVPDVSRILHDLAFWDIYYEHCSYFSSGSLARLFRNCGFEVIDLNRDYDDQYLMIEGRACNGKSTPRPTLEDDLEEMACNVAFFCQNYREKLNDWMIRFQTIRNDRRRAVLWGGSSKAVAFLTTLKIQEEVEYVVDINPYKHGTYMPGTGQLIVAPDFLVEYKPDAVIVMNPIYREEIRHDLRQIGLDPELILV